VRYLESRYPGADKDKYNELQRVKGRTLKNGFFIGQFADMLLRREVQRKVRKGGLARPGGAGVIVGQKGEFS